MGWNHRIIVTEYKGTYSYDVHEVYYDKNGKPDGYTARPITVGGESIEGVEWQLSKINESLSKPYLWGDDKFPKEFNADELNR